MKFKYPCAFNWIKKEKIWIAEFPDWMDTINALTYGKSWGQVMYMANDLLNMICLITEEDNLPFPKPCSTSWVGVVHMIDADTEKYAKAVEQYKRVGRYRMAERARERYWYHKKYGA